MPIAIAIAFSPFTVVAVVLVQGSPEGPAAGLSFLFGWLFGLTTLTFLMILLLGGAESEFAIFGPMMQLVIGVLLLWAAWKKWRGRPRGAIVPEPPGWLRSLTTVTPGRAMVVGAMIGGVNPKNVALAIAGSAIIVGHELYSLGTVVAGAVFVALSTVTVFGTVMYRLLGGAKAETSLGVVKDFMLRNNNVILMLLFLLIGVKVLGDGLSALAASELY
nr:GAP family protein [Pseudoruegeria sp. HB172150]